MCTCSFPDVPIAFGQTAGNQTPHAYGFRVQRRRPEITVQIMIMVTEQIVVVMAIWYVSIQVCGMLKDYQFLRSRWCIRNHAFSTISKNIHVARGAHFLRIRQSIAADSIQRFFCMLGISACSMRMAQWEWSKAHYECRYCSWCTRNENCIEFSRWIILSMRAIDAAWREPLFVRNKLKKLVVTFALR